MNTTPFLGIPLISASTTMNTLDWALGVNGEGDDSMASKIDKALEAQAHREIYSAEKPEGQAEGDIWYEILTTEDAD